MPRLKLHQVVRLREIFQKWRQFALRSRGLSVESSPAPRSASRHPVAPPLAGVPPGHLAVYVGPERERVVIKTSLLAHPLFRALLKKTEAEIGFRYEGGLAIPCSISAFRSLLLLMQGNKRSMLTTAALHSQLQHQSRPNGLGECNHHELQLLLQELHGLHVRDVSSHLAIRCVPEPRLNPLADAVLQEPIYG